MLKNNNLLLHFHPLFSSLLATGPCASSPCQNGGQCFMNGDDTAYTCLCTSDFAGMNCELTALIATSATTGK